MGIANRRVDDKLKVSGQDSCMSKKPASAPKTDEEWMKIALKAAARAEKRGEVPVGAILVSLSGECLAIAGNCKESIPTPIGHAEILCLHRAARAVEAWRLVGCTMYVTLEPCVMCAGAMIQARIKRVVFGTRDPKGGAVDSLYEVLSDPRLNHQVEISSGVMQEECAQMLKSFFRKRRQMQN